MRHFRLIVLSIIVFVLLFGCARLPQQQVQQSQSALGAAEAAGAARYAPEAWNRARQAKERLDAELAAQAGKLRPFRNYSKAVTLAGEVVQAADRARAEAETRKQQVRADLEAGIADSRRLLLSAREQLRKVPRTAAFDAAANSAKLDEAGRKLDQAQADLAAGRLESAMAGAAEARDGITAVLRSIEQATARPVSKKR